jgi:DNA-binding transcriptional LysR family regulator
MRELERNLGSVRNLVAFESAARLGSFSAAALELGVTQPAVSQAVRRLETAIGARLFQRGHRAISLTDAGARLHEDVADGFARILATARQIGRAGHRDHVTVLASTAFATWWMVPRLGEFRARYPAVDLRLETLDKDLDISAEATSLAVRRGNGHWPGYEAALIAPERLAPVASPALIANRGSLRRVRDLATWPLIHLDEPHRYRPGWRDYLAHFGTAYRDTGGGLRLNDYALVLQAAMAGEGVALGWMHVCARPLAQGWLQTLGPPPWETGDGFYLVWSASQKISPHAELIRDWILAQAGMHDVAPAGKNPSRAKRDGKRRPKPVVEVDQPLAAEIS